MHHHQHRHRHGHHEHGFGLRFARPGPLDPEERGYRHRGGRHRMFDHGDLRFILLGMIAAKPAHGYDLIKALSERMGGGYSPSPGVIYPTLTMLEEQGYATAVMQDGKRLYAATDAGRAWLAENKAAAEAIEARISARAREHRAELPARLVRAMENLRTALRLRLAAGPIPDERIVAIAAAIDAAAAAAEEA